MTVVVSDVGKGALDVSGREREDERRGSVEMGWLTSEPGCWRDSGISLAGARLLARRVCHERGEELDVGRGS